MSTARDALDLQAWLATHTLAGSRPVRSRTR
jgi:hypothetical protein